MARNGVARLNKGKTRFTHSVVASALRLARVAYAGGFGIHRPPADNGDADAARMATLTVSQTRQNHWYQHRARKY
jgi:hypothetical protein